MQLNKRLKRFYGCKLISGFARGLPWKKIEPKRHYSDKFNLRIPTDLHEKFAIAAQASGESINTLAQEALLQIVQ